MAIQGARVLLFALGGLVAASGTAYVTGLLDPWFGRAPVTEASLSQDEPGSPDAAPDEAVSPDAVPEAEAPTEVAADPEQADEAAAELVAPTFDLLRVEPDGSIVIAGQAAPSALVEVVEGEDVLGSSDASQDGDFAVVLDDPLSPGDHQLVLRATIDGQVANSAQTALVSIPETPDGDVLALVDEPGRPSELITVPARPEAEGEVVADAAEEAAPDASQEIAAAEEGETAQDGEDAAPAPDAAAAEPDAGAGDAPADVASAPAAEDEAVEQDVAETPAAEPVEDMASAEPAEEGAAADAAGEIAEPAEDIASLPEAAPADEPQAEAPAAIAPSTVVVEAVEIEGDMVFVAGVADPGSTVRVYANDILLGDALAAPNGRFLVEARRPLPVGDYIIRADLLAEDGTVLARAAVPFEREEGESIAAVAPQPQPEAQLEPESSEEIAAADEPAPAEGAVPEMAAGEPDAADELAMLPDAGEDAPGEPEAQPDAAATPDASAAMPDDGDAGVVEEEEASPGEQIAAPPVQDEVAAASDAGDGSAQSPADADMADAAAPGPETEAGPATAEDEPVEAPAQTAEDGAVPGDADMTEAAPDDAAAPEATETEVAAAPAIEAGQEVTAPPLERVEGSVIIRRGDTLWRISRRVYGRGVRYSTIYLANQDQIADPDRIWPGQVFSVPGETAEGEEADLGRIADQAIVDGVPMEEAETTRQ
jgi:nucleoid-associated protein YgaU